MPGCDRAGAAERSYPPPEARGGGREELPHAQGGGCAGAGGPRGTYTLLYVKQIASGNLVYDTGNSNWGSVTT